MLKKYIVLLCLLPLQIVCFDELSLVNHVKQSISNAKNEISKLSPSVLSLDGMSSSKGRHLLNNICSLPNASYLEVGVWKGSTLIAALYENTQTVAHAIAIDNWSEFKGPRGIFLENVSLFLPNFKSLKFYDEDCFSINLQKSDGFPIDIYFYDGNHTFESQLKAFTYFNNVLADTFIAIVDDWNHGPTKRGTRQAFKDLKYKILFEEELPANFNGDTANWWNGIYIAVIKKH